MEPTQTALSDFFFAAVERQPAGVAFVDKDDRLVFMNEALRQMTGYDLAQALESGGLQDKRDEVAASGILELLQTRDRWEGASLLKTRGAASRHYRVVATAHRGPSGELLGFAAYHEPLNRSELQNHRLLQLLDFETVVARGLVGMADPGREWPRIVEELRVFFGFTRADLGTLAVEQEQAVVRSLRPKAEPLALPGRFEGVSGRTRFEGPEEDLLAVFGSVPGGPRLALLFWGQRGAPKLLSSEERFLESICLAFSTMLERQQAISGLREQVDGLARMVQASDELFWQWDPVSDSLRFKEGQQSVVGLESELLERASNWFGRWVHPEDLAAFRQTIGQLERGEREQASFEFRALARGQWTWFKCTAHAPLDPARPKPLVVGALANIQTWKSMASRAEFENSLLKDKMAAQSLSLKRKDAELDFKSELFHVVFRMSELPMLIMDSKGLVREANPAFEGQFGRAEGPIWRLEAFKPEEADALRQAIRQNRDSLKLKIATGDEAGPHRSFETVLQRIRSEAARPHFWTWTAYETTHVGLALEELRLNRDILLESQILGKVGTITMRKPSNEMVWSQGMYRIFEIEPGQGFEPSPEAFLRLVHPDDRQRMALQNHKIFEMASQLPLEVEYRVITLDNKTKILKGRGSLLHDQDGKVIGSVASVHDVTDLRRKEQEVAKLTERLSLEVNLKAEELAKTNKHLRLFSDNAELLVCTHDDSFRVIYANRFSKVLLGLEPSELEGRTWCSLFPPGYRPVFEKAREKARGGGFTVRTRLEAARGRFTTLSTTFSRIQDPEGEAGSWTSITRDLTQAEMNEARERKLVEAREEFVRFASHEFKTPLATIQTSAELINSYLAREAQVRHKAEMARHTERIFNTVTHMQEFLDKFINLGQYGMSQYKPELSRFDLLDFIENLKEHLLLREWQSRRIVHQVHGQPYEVLLDRKLLHHCLLNLWENGLKYSEGDLRVELFFGPEELRLEVSDQGRGIPPEDLERIFEPFARASNADDKPGSGLGLGFARICAERNGGLLSCHSQLGKGSTFALRFPRPKA